MHAIAAPDVLPLPPAGPDLTRPLRAWWVSDYDIIAAVDECQALDLANDICRPLEPYTPDDVVEVAPVTLDEPHAGEDGPWTLRELLAAQTKPGYLAGYEQ